MSVTVTVTEIADNDIIITADQVIVTTHEGTALFNADEIADFLSDMLEKVKEKYPSNFFNYYYNNFKDKTFLMVTDNLPAHGAP